MIREEDSKLIKMPKMKSLNLYDLYCYVSRLKLFKYISRLFKNVNYFSDWKQRIVAFLLENRISLYSPHTSWDCVRGGVNDWLASAFHFAESTPILPGTDPNFGAGR